MKVIEPALKTTPCPCGSGLRAVRCCEMDASAAALPENAALLDEKGNEATRFFNERKYAEAEALALQMLDAVPNQRTGLRVLFEIRKAQNRHGAALALGRRLADLPGPAPARLAANSIFAQYLVAQGRHAEARAPAAAAVKAAPRDATAQHVMGVVLTETGAVLEGETHYRRALKYLGREDGLVLANLAWNLKLQGRLRDAAALYESALSLRADNRRGVGGKAQVEFGRGNRQAAIAVLDEALSKWGDDRTLRLLRVMADLAQAQPQAALERLGPPEPLMAPEILARAQAFDALGQWHDAATAISNARALQRERGGLIYQPEALLARAAAYKAYFMGERVQPLPRAGAGASTPVFLLGFPRAGTSLLEQLLAQLPGFAAGDEFTPIAELADFVPHLTASAAPYPEALDDMLTGAGADVPAQLRRIHENKRIALGLARPDVHFITDRAHTNFWHLGLIKLLYPHAPIIHVLRHPYDLMLANITHDRKLEGNANAGLPALARYYALHAEMIRHYRGQLTLRYLPVRYEDLVANPGQVLREIMSFIGTEQNLPASIAANNAALSEPVAPHFALREPVHTRRAYRYRAYLAALPQLFAEVEPVLAPWLDELGYSVEAAPQAERAN